MMNTELLERLAQAARVQRAREAARTRPLDGVTRGAAGASAGSPAGPRAAARSATPRATPRAGRGGRRPVALAGDLAVFRAFDICQLLTMAEETGVLEVRAPGVRGEVLIEAGRVVGARSRPQPRRLGRLLVDGGQLGQPELDDALARQIAAGRRGGPGRRLGAMLVERGALRPADLERGLAAQAESALAALLILPAGRFAFRRRPLPEGAVRILADPEGLVLAALARFDELRAGRTPA
jgi:hypothetical protein